MKFETLKDTFRYWSVTGWESEEQQTFLELALLSELSMDEYLSFIDEIEPEVKRGVFLSPPPRFVG